MPEIGPGGSALVVGWLKRPGESVHADEPLCMVSCNEQPAEVSSPATGVIRLHCVARGDRVGSGDSLGLIDASA